MRCNKGKGRRPNLLRYDEKIRRQIWVHYRGCHLRWLIDSRFREAKRLAFASQAETLAKLADP